MTARPVGIPELHTKYLFVTLLRSLACDLILDIGSGVVGGSGNRRAPRGPFPRLSPNPRWSNQLRSLTIRHCGI
jgi:hypothetical protein